MRLQVVAMTAVLLLPAAALSDDKGVHDHDHVAEAVAVSLARPPIRITINPEERISVTLWGSLPPPVPCGSAADLSVQIENQGFVTAQLEAELVADAPAGVTLDFRAAPLKGVPEESRTLHITLTKPGPTDLTIGFRAHNGTPDLGGRDRVHFLMHCLPENRDRDTR